MSALPAGWIEAKLSAVATARMGKTILSKELVASGLPVFSASVGSEPWGYVDDWSTAFPRGTLVISARGTIGDVKLPEHDSFVSTQTTIALQPSGAVVPSFLRSLLSAFDWPSVTATTAIPMLTIGKLDDVGVVVPPLAEQRRIVAKLDALTARTARARADLDRIPALAARYKQAVLAKAFSGELTADLEIGASDFLAGTFTAEEVSGRSPAVGDLPEGWLWTSVGALTTVTGGLTKNAKRATAPLQVSYLRVANVYADELRLSEVATIGCTEGEFEKTRLQRGDLLIVEGNGSLEQVGRAAVWNDELEACSHQNHLIRLRAAKHLMPRYLLLWLSSPAGRVAIEGVASSSSGLHTLSVSKVKGLPLPLCGLDEQRVIVSRIDQAFTDIDRMVTEAAAARRLLDRLDQAILARAFQGDLVPQDPADEPASVLLDRIRAERAAAAPKVRRGRKAAS